MRCIPATGEAGLSAVVPTGIVIAPVDAVPTNPDTAMLVAAATPNTGVIRVGEVPNTLAPLPVEVVTPVPPLATGSVPLIFVVKEQYAVAVEFVPPLAMGRVPVTPVVIGRPVQLVSVPLEGVPKAPPDEIKVPVVAGRVITVVPAIAGAAIVTEPEIFPAKIISAKIMPLYFYNYRNAIFSWVLSHLIYYNVGMKLLENVCLS